MFDVEDRRNPAEYGLVPCIVLRSVPRFNDENGGSDSPHTSQPDRSRWLLGRHCGDCSHKVGLCMCKHVKHVYVARANYLSFPAVEMHRFTTKGKPLLPLSSDNFYGKKERSASAHSFIFKILGVCVLIGVGIITWFNIRQHHAALTAKQARELEHAIEAVQVKQLHMAPLKEGAGEVTLSSLLAKNRDLRMAVESARRLVEEEV